jgi:hypothetical protein
MKKFKIDDKLVINKNKNKIPSKSYIKNVYSKIPDNKNIPIVFKTRKQYLDSYIKNQEKTYGKNFSKKEKQQYYNSELKNLKNVTARYTTKDNPYMDPKIVYFNDTKISNKDFEKNAYHEFAHELIETKPAIKNLWHNNVKQKDSPTLYGTTDLEEDFAESYTIYKNKGGIITNPVPISTLNKRMKLIEEIENSYKEDDNEIDFKFEDIKSDDQSKNSVKPNKLIRNRIENLDVVNVKNFDYNNDESNVEYDNIHILDKRGLKSNRNEFYKIIKKDPSILSDLENNNTTLIIGQKEAFTDYSNFQNKDQKTETTAWSVPKEKNVADSKNSIILPINDYTNDNVDNLNHELGHIKQFNRGENLVYSGNDNENYYDDKYEKEAEKYAIDKKINLKGQGSEILYDKIYEDTTKEKEYSDEELIEAYKQSKKAVKENREKNIIQGMEYLDSIEQDNVSKNMATVNLDEYGQDEHASKFGFNPKKTFIHGTTYEDALAIKNSKMFNNGTLVFPGRGGFEDASNWAVNTKGDTGVVVMMEAEDLNSNNSWTQVGKRYEEYGEGVPGPVKLNKVKILKINKTIKPGSEYKIPSTITDEYDEPYEGYNKIEQDNVSKNNQQSLWYAGNISPNERIKQNGYVYGFSHYNFAKSWQSKYKYKHIWNFITDQYQIDTKTYSRNIDGKNTLNDNEFIAKNVLAERLIE